MIVLIIRKHILAKIRCQKHLYEKELQITRQKNKGYYLIK